MNVPIIKLEVEGMKYAVRTALSAHAAQMDTNIQEAVEAFCTEDNIASIIREAAARALDTAIRQEVESFFRFGDGRKAVAEAVKESILSKKTYTLLDET